MLHERDIEMVLIKPIQIARNTKQDIELTYSPATGFFVLFSLGIMVYRTQITSVAIARYNRLQVKEL